MADVCSQHLDSKVCKTSQHLRTLQSDVLVSYLDLHVEVSLLTLLPLLCLHPFLLLQTLHQLLGDVHVSHWQEHLAWDTRTHECIIECSNICAI